MITLPGNRGQVLVQVGLPFDYLLDQRISLFVGLAGLQLKIRSLAPGADLSALHRAAPRRPTVLR
jgi:hypothetical protein